MISDLKSLSVANNILSSIHIIRSFCDVNIDVNYSVVFLEGKVGLII